MRHEPEFRDAAQAMIDAAVAVSGCASTCRMNAHRWDHSDARRFEDAIVRLAVAVAATDPESTQTEGRPCVDPSS